ncbi:MAG: cytochrome C biogenesis protein, partial [Flavobacteriia bacterium]|nr:cytochrome C biogenesis protein [Flavobacteriia bacterium]
MNYLGEHTFWSELGRFFVALSFAGALLSAFFYGFQAFRSPAERAERPVLPLRNAGRWSFALHALGVLGTIGVLFAALFNHWFEFDYVWRHSSLDMPMEYIASCFWEGQEGSFLLWMTWHAVLGLILIKTAKTWEYGTLMTLSLIQLFLASMLGRAG